MWPEATVTPEEKARISELPKLIANERDAAKIKVLAAELERLLIMEGKWLRATREKPKSS